MAHLTGYREPQHQRASIHKPPFCRFRKITSVLRLCANIQTSRVIQVQSIDGDPGSTTPQLQTSWRSRSAKSAGDQAGCPCKSGNEFKAILNQEDPRCPGASLSLLFMVVNYHHSHLSNCHHRFIVRRASITKAITISNRVASFTVRGNHPLTRAEDFMMRLKNSVWLMS